MNNRFITYLFKLRITRHIIFWIIYLLFFTIMYGQFDGKFYLQLIMQLYYLPVVIAATYFTIYFLIPRYLQTRKYFLFSLFLIGSAFLFSALQRLNIVYILVPIQFPEEAEKYTFFNFQLIFRILEIYPPVILAAAIKLFEDWFRNQQIHQQLEKDKLQAELKFLKAQIHPHFLFNILNSLYALTLKKSEKAPEVVLKLSDLLSYMLYDCNASMVPLKKEINLINDYIELEKLRYGEKLDIEFNVQNQENNIQIAPLLLLPFVENSFKHGVSKKVSDKWIKISLFVDDYILLLNVVNSKNTNRISNEQNYTEGIGLQNVKRRLDLLYENKYELEINESEDKFAVNLRLELN